MKLLHRSSRYRLALALPLLLVGTMIGVLVVHWVVTNQVDEQLEHETAHITTQLKQGVRTFTTNATDELIVVAPGSAGAAPPKDTTRYDEEEQEMMPWRISRSVTTLADGSSYVITVGRSLVETEDLIIGVALSMGALLVLLFLGHWLLDRWLADRLWRPFQSALQELRQFQLDGSQPPHFPDTNVDEFTSLNRSLKTMTTKLRSDFTLQKRFTEQAAHELHTPLAIMQGKLDQLIQSPNLKEADAEVIDGLFQARERMGRTVGNMLLLARIGNQQFPPQHIDWTALFEEQRRILEELITQRDLRFSIHQEQPCGLHLHPMLADVLVGNLLRNAVQHNIQAGSIRVVMHADGFVSENTGPVLEVPAASLFDRFVKGDPSSPSTGLGLAMVKEIADQNGLRLNYNYAVGMHTLTVRAA
jgi:signal transduction histidine kinase